MSAHFMNCGISAQQCCLLGIYPFKLTSFKSSLMWEMSVPTFQVQLCYVVVNVLDFQPRRLRDWIPATAAAFLWKQNTRGQCAQIKVHFKKSQVVGISGASHYGVSYSHVVVLAHQTPTISFWHFISEKPLLLHATSCLTGSPTKAGKIPLIACICNWKVVQNKYLYL